MIKIDVGLINGVGAAMGVFAQPCAINAAQIFRVGLFFQKHAATFEATLAATIAKSTDVFGLLQCRLIALAGKIAMHGAHFHQRVQMGKAFADGAEITPCVFHLAGHDGEHRRTNRHRQNNAGE